MNNEKFMELALKEAKKAYKKNEVPIGAIIVKNNKVISKAHNIKEKTHKVSSHAEMIAIEKACKKTKNWRLIDCELYTTVEPCLMCTGAIIQSKINTVYYSIKNEKFGYLEKINELSERKINTNQGLLKEKTEKMMKQFFENKRK